MPRARPRRQVGGAHALTQPLDWVPVRPEPTPYVPTPPAPTPVAEKPPAADPVVLHQGEIEVVAVAARQAELEGRADEAVALLNEEIREVPQSVELLVLRGSILGRQRRLAEAEADLRQALQLQPSHGQALLDLGLTLWRRGLAVQAAETLDRAAAHQPQNPVAFNYL